MKTKDIYTKTALPIYEVTELTMREALLALSTHRGKTNRPGTLPEEGLQHRQTANLRQH